MLPNFLIIGAAKSGTTSLYHYLKQHPEIYMSPVKEPYFFSFMNENVLLKGPFDTATQKQIITDIKDYINLFENVKNEKAIGECSNSYLYFYKKSGNNIKKIIPNCKIIAILRNPVERTFSHYTQMVMIGHEDLSFREAIAKENERMKNGWRWHYQYTGQSKYYEPVKWYLENFGEENVKIYLFDDLVNRPHILINEILKFLNINFKLNFDIKKKYNISGNPRIKTLHNIIIKDNNKLRHILGLFIPKEIKGKIINFIMENNLKRKHISKNDKEYLIEMFYDDIINLQELINRKLNNWFK